MRITDDEIRLCDHRTRDHVALGHEPRCPTCRREEGDTSISVTDELSRVFRLARKRPRPIDPIRRYVGGR